MLDESEQLLLLQSFDFEIHIWKYIGAPLIKKKKCRKNLEITRKFKKTPTTHQLFINTFKIHTITQNVNQE